jgi:membrane-associated phospholipid phosphatase
MNTECVVSARTVLDSAVSNGGTLPGALLRTLVAQQVNAFRCQEGCRMAKSRVHPVLAVLSMAVGGYLAICAVFIGVGLLVTHQLSALTRWDDSVVRSFADHRTSSLNHWTDYATKVADTFGILIVLVVAVIVLLLFRHRWDALFLVLALGLELATFLTVNTVVGRPRPSGPRLGSLPSTSSFPSGHTAAMVALYGGLAVLINARLRARIVGLVAWLVAVLAAAAIGLARVYRGMHHPSDVIAGALMGFAVLTVAFLAVRAAQRAAAERAEAERVAAEREHLPAPVPHRELDPKVAASL